MGLIQREMERAGIPTIGISIVRRFSEKINPPRTVFLDWPFGHPLGKPFHVAQQRSVILAAFRALNSIRTPGEIVDLPYSWKGHEHGLNKLALNDQLKDRAGRGLVQIGEKKG